MSLAYSSLCNTSVVYNALYILYIYSISSLCVSREIGIHANSFFAFTFGLCLLVLFFVHAISRPQK